jgi:DNA-binding beta-propeller fold protein YncE
MMERLAAGSAEYRGPIADALLRWACRWAGQFEVAVSGDDRYVYVTDETTGGLSVFDLAVALRHGFTARGVAVGLVPLAHGAVGVTLSPGGTLVYVTTLGAYGPHGRLWVINAAQADGRAAHSAVLAHVAAGCQPARVAVSPDGSTLWVTALQSNALLAFSAAAARSGSSRALRAVVQVGSEPVGLLLVDNGRMRWSPTPAATWLRGQAAGRRPSASSTPPRR